MYKLPCYPCLQFLPTSKVALVKYMPHVHIAYYIFFTSSMAWWCVIADTLSFVLHITQPVLAFLRYTCISNLNLLLDNILYCHYHNFLALFNSLFNSLSKKSLWAITSWFPINELWHNLYNLKLLIWYYFKHVIYYYYIPDLYSAFSALNAAQW